MAGVNSVSTYVNEPDSLSNSPEHTNKVDDSDEYDDSLQHVIDSELTKRLNECETPSERVKCSVDIMLAAESVHGATVKLDDGHYSDLQSLKHNDYHNQKESSEMFVLSEQLHAEETSDKGLGSEIVVDSDTLKSDIDNDGPLSDNMSSGFEDGLMREFVEQDVPCIDLEPRIFTRPVPADELDNVTELVFDTWTTADEISKFEAQSDKPINGLEEPETNISAPIVIVENNKECFDINAPVITNSVKSSFGKFDQLEKKAILQQRSLESDKGDPKQNGVARPEVLSECKSCNKTVYAMEQIKAERQVWHKNCFRCTTCNKQLTVDIYSSHEGLLYCKPHFKELFQPKVVVEEEEPTSDKPDLGLEELSSLNVKSRFQAFENGTTNGHTSMEKSPISVKRSPSILSKMAKFKSKGMDIGVPNEALNGAYFEPSSSESENEDDQEKSDVTKNCITKEKPMSFDKMDSVKRNWEMRKEEIKEEHKQEIQNIRSKLFLGKQGKMKQMYEQAVAESERTGVKRDVNINKTDKAKVIKEKFEKGEIVKDENEDEVDENIKTNQDDEMSVFEAGISKKSRSHFMELDANVAKTMQSPPVSSTKKEFTPNKPGESPEPDIYRDPNVVRSEDTVDEAADLVKSNTTTKMLSLFRQLEVAKQDVPEGPKPLKRFTPPPDYKESSGTESESEEVSDSEEEESSCSETNDNVVKSSVKIEDEFLKNAQNAAKAKSLKEKFEHWEPDKHSMNNAVTMLDSEQESIESTKSLRARFESLKAEQPTEKPKPKVNRFVQQSDSIVLCESCEKKVYPLEKVEIEGRPFHRTCFKCTQCQCVLRMDTFTWNNNRLYCLPHFKRLFISKGNYDEGFGGDQHKKKWETNGHVQSSQIIQSHPTN